MAATTIKASTNKVPFVLSELLFKVVLLTVSLLHELIVIPTIRGHIRQKYLYRDLYVNRSKRVSKPQLRLYRLQAR